MVNSSINNGIGGTTSYELTEHGNVITYGDTVDGNTIFYRAKPFLGYSHVKVMEPEEKCNPTEMIFLTAVIGRWLSDGNYDYINKMTTNRVLNTIIMLPALSDGTPDWATDDVNVLTLKEDQLVNVKLFLMSCLRQSGKRYGFADKWTVSKIKKDVIKLPVDISGNPDWQYVNKHLA